MARAGWTTEVIPPQVGRTALVTGATSGTGYEAALALARAGAHVVLTARDPAKGARAMATIRAVAPAATLSLQCLDTASLASVGALAAGWDGPRLDILLLNAGIAWVPQRAESADGYELQLATNFLGHFALAGLLAPHLAADARVVPVASLAHRSGRLDFDDLQSRRAYSPKAAYRQSKLAMLMFGLELDRRFRAAGSAMRAVPAHPGFARTDIFRRGGQASRLQRLVGHAAFGLLGQSAARGALPLLYAATAPEAEGGGYYGPGGRGEATGLPAPARIAAHARDADAARRLWASAQALTGVRAWE